MTGCAVLVALILIWQYSKGHGTVGTPGQGGRGTYIDMHSHTTEYVNFPP